MLKWKIAAEITTITTKKMKHIKLEETKGGFGEGGPFWLMGHKRESAESELII